MNPLLEAFGNARTRINENSSRFGKYLELYFEQDGTVVGAKFKEYLLEKSRIVYQNSFESTFHIFYLMFAGLTQNEKQKYSLLKTPEQYRFMSDTKMSNEFILSKENEKQFSAIRESMKTIGFIQEVLVNFKKPTIAIAVQTTAKQIFFSC